MTRPLLYVSDILPQIDPDLASDGEVDKMIQAGIDRLLSMQTASGGFGVWPGSNDPVLWGTAYVVHLLLDARDRGYKVPDAALAEAIDWLDRNAESEPGGPKFRGTHPGYVQYVLARAGKPHTAQVAALLAQAPKAKSGRDLEGQYLLMAALHQAGDHRYEAQLRAVDTSPLSDERLNDWSYYSDLRRRGMTLAVYHELFGRDAAATPLADLVAEGLEKQQARYFTTQELMWGVTGLGKWVGAPEQGLPEPELYFNGRKVAPSRDRDAGNGQVAWQIAGASRAASLEVRLPARAAGKLTLVSTTEGVKPNEVQPIGGNGLAVERTWLTSTGGTLGAEHALGDLIYVSVALTNTTRRTLDNVALVDRIPAGWEIENPRLGRGSLPDWIDPDELWTPDYLDLKDDRFMVFGKLEPGQTVRVVYAVRAVTAGEFTVPPVSAEAMYDPRLWAREGGKTVRIAGGWEKFLL